jgi:RNA polymerase sigma factor (sigma-70 family)
MNKINELVIQYQKTKDKNILNEIFKELESTIDDIAKKTFYRKEFIKRIYNVEIYDKKKEKLITKQKKDYFKICDTRKLTIKDIKQELYIFILELINKCKSNKPFENYLYSSISKWIPSFINEEFIKNLDTQSIYKINEEGEEINLVDEIPSQEEPEIEFKQDLTDFEQKVWDLKINNLNLSQEEIAKELDVDQATISRAFADIKKKLQK